MSGRQRFWLLYNVVALTLITGLGVVTMFGGGTRNLLAGAALVLVGAYLAERTVRGLRDRAGPAQVSDVRLGTDGVVVLNGDADGPGEAALAWADCVAVVASPVVHGGGYYVHFMPARDDAVVLRDVPGQLLRSRAALVDLPATPSAAMLWIGGEAVLPRMYAALDRVRLVRPDLRVVDSIRRGADG